MISICCRSISMVDQDSLFLIEIFQRSTMTKTSSLIKVLQFIASRWLINMITLLTKSLENKNLGSHIAFVYRFRNVNNFQKNAFLLLFINCVNTHVTSKQTYIKYFPFRNFLYLA